jgi:hypothetical protein
MPSQSRTASSYRRLPALDAADRRWLRSLFERAVCASLAAPLASVLATQGCAAESETEAAQSDAGAMQMRQPGTNQPDAGPSQKDQPWCVDGSVANLASGFTLAREVDYVADRDPLEVLSQRGTACGTARDAAACRARIAAASALQRNLLTTEGDDVRIWLVDAAPELLGAIDTPEEALWIAAASDYVIDCNSKVSRVEKRYVIDNALRSTASCQFDLRVRATIAVDKAGLIEELSAVDLPMAPCAVAGRRPAGLQSAHRARTRSALGDHFARMAHMEAASVPAFAAITAELRHHRAPRHLITAAEAARLDEIGHASITASLARRFGAEPTRPEVRRTHLRGVFELALDNAVEGCVHETYAALEATHQAARATDARIAAAMRVIADDETRHAALSHSMQGWLLPQLSMRERAHIDGAQREAVDALRGTLAAAHIAPTVQMRAGVPDRLTALALHDSLRASIWS